MRVAVDTDALVKITKASVKELMASSFQLVLPPRVKLEAVDEGKRHGYPDALQIEENLGQGKLRLEKTRKSRGKEGVLRALGLQGGEADALRLLQAGRADIVLSDDGKFLRRLDALGVPYATPAALLVALVETGKLEPRTALAQLEKLAPYVSEQEYREARRAIQEVGARP